MRKTYTASITTEKQNIMGCVSPGFADIETADIGFVNMQACLYLYFLKEKKSTGSVLLRKSGTRKVEVAISIWCAIFAV